MVARAFLLSTGRSLLYEPLGAAPRRLELLRARIAALGARGRDLEGLNDLRPPRTSCVSGVLWRASGPGGESVPEWIDIAVCVCTCFVRVSLGRSREVPV